MFDEPTNGPDYNSMAWDAPLKKELAEKGKIIFVVTHNCEFICHTCTRVIQFDNGALARDFAVECANEDFIKGLFHSRTKQEA